MATASNDGSHGLSDLLTLYRQLSAISAAVFAPLARTYVGNLEAKSDRRLESEAVVNLALRKLAFEAGELLVAGNAPTEKPIPEFQYDEHGRLPDLKLSYVAAAALAYTKMRDKRAADQATARNAAARSTLTPQVDVLTSAASVRALRYATRSMAYGRGATMTSGVTAHPGPPLSSSPHGGGCGCGSVTDPVPQPPPCYDPCAGGLVPVPPFEEPSSCSCQACQTAPAECPPFWSVSCETKLKLRECVKKLVCDLIAWIETVVCSKAQPNTPAAVICNFLHCVRDALCAPPPQPCLPKPTPMACLPCDYAVERS
jgi:hypothetical protein